MATKKTLLERYGMPLHHLDFKYVKECEDPREMEKIVHVLQSGEEGYYPDLTKCAEDKLRLLKPNSRLFRCEEPVLRGSEINASELKPIKEFSRKVRDKDKRLAAMEREEEGVVPIRQAGKISLNKTDESSGNTTAASTAPPYESSGKKKIPATDYRKWDRYDPDEEILRMELAEEREQEKNEIKNRLNRNEVLQTPLIEEIKEEDERIRKLTDIEKENLAEESRLRGNEYFRVKEYDSAIQEYSRAIKINPAAAASYNNRAITYIKLKKYDNAIEDCEKCLSIEPNNVKALYRLGQSNMEKGFKDKALEIFNKLLEIDPNNTSARNCVKTLEMDAPASATRLRITEGPKGSETQLPEENSTKNLKISKKNASTKSKSSKKKEKCTDYDLASVVRPKKIHPSKFMEAAANLVGNENEQKKDKKSFANIKTEENTDENEIKVRLPIFEKTANSQTLIEEL